MSILDLLFPRFDRVDLMLDREWAGTDGQPSGFEDLRKEDQLRALVAAAVMRVYGSSWTTPEHRLSVAEAALAVQRAWDQRLEDAARELFPEIFGGEEE